VKGTPSFRPLGLQGRPHGRPYSRCHKSPDPTELFRSRVGPKGDHGRVARWLKATSAGKSYERLRASGAAQPGQSRRAVSFRTFLSGMRWERHRHPSIPAGHGFEDLQPMPWGGFRARSQSDFQEVSPPAPWRPVVNFDTCIKAPFAGCSVPDSCFDVLLTACTTPHASLLRVWGL